jgi:hypothetical protein
VLFVLVVQALLLDLAALVGVVALAQKEL